MTLDEEEKGSKAQNGLHMTEEHSSTITKLIAERAKHRRELQSMYAKDRGSSKETAIEPSKQANGIANGAAGSPSKKRKYRNIPFSLESSKAAFSAAQSLCNGGSDPSASLSPRGQEDTRQNPYFLPSVKSPVSETPKRTNDSLEPPQTPPPKSSPQGSPSKRVIQFSEDSSQDNDSDYKPHVKRKKRLNLLSPRHSQSPKALTTPVKREELASRKLELEYERKKLPIWTGMFYLSCH